MDINPNFKEIKLSAVLNGIALFIRALLGGIIAYIFVNSLTKTDYGYLTLIISFLAVLEAFADLGIGVSTSVFIAKSISRKINVFSCIISGFVLRTITILIIFILIFFFPNFVATTILNQPNLSNYIHYIAIGFIFCSYLLFFGRILQGLHSSSLRSIGILSDVILYFTFSIFFVVILNQGLLGVITSYNISKIIAFSVILLLLIYRFKKIKLTLSKNLFIFKDIKNISKYALPLSVTTLSAIVFIQLPILLLGKFSNPEQIGYYGLASKIVLILTIPSQAIIFSVSTALTHYKEKSIDSVSIKISRLLEISFLLFLPLMIYVFLSANRIIILLNPEFNESIIILKILSLLILFNSLTIITGGILGFIGHAKIEAISYLISTTFLLISGLFLFNRYNIIGMSLAAIFASMINCTINLVYLI
ncbi:MAG: hypothetical protein APR63_14255, partial [Desulfuromonas sp. SDB]